MFDWWWRRWHPTPPSPAPPTRDAVIALINDQRKVSGRPAFLPSPWLDSVAQEWANWMKEHNTLMHGNFIGRLAGYTAAEDIAMGETSPEQVVADWMKSPPHRANILGDYTIIGVGIALPYWCVDFVK